MPRYRIITYVIDEYEQHIHADNEQSARDIAYAEVEQDIPPGGYVEYVVTQLQE
jgi:hypothetical protein